MFLVSDGASAAKKRTSSSVFCLPSSRCSVSFGSLDAGLVSFSRSVQAHPFNQKVVILVSFEDACESEESTFSPAALAEVEREEHKQHRASRQPRASSSCPSSSPASSSSPFLCSSSSSSSPSSFSSSSCEARELVMRRLVELVQARSTGVFLHDVSLASFLSLPLQKFLFSQHDACLLSWTGASPLCASPFPCPSLARAGEGQAAEEREQATNGFLCSDVYLSDVATGGNAAAMTAEEGGSLLMRVDGFLYQTLGVDTLASLPHSVKKALPSTTRFLRIPLAHPAVLRHQRALEPERPSPDAERSVKREGNLRRKKSRASQPSKMFLHLQHCLGEKLAPLSFLCALKMPFPGVGDSAFSHLSTLRASLEQLLRAANSSAAFVALTGVSAQHRRYLSPSAVTGEAEEGEANSLPREADDSFLAFEADSPQEKEGRSPGETRQAGSRARENNPDVWLPNWNKLLARLRQAAERRNRDEDGEASRATSRRKRAGNLQRSTISEACDDSDESDAILDVSMEEETDTEQEREQGEGEMEEEKQFPFPRLKARLESAALRLAFGEFAEARKGERDDRRQGTEREKLADEIIQVLGSYGLDIPLSFAEDQDSLPHVRSLLIRLVLSVSVLLGLCQSF
ncbi:hypothetical protein TGMAS_202170 [Toxoplasma gondii MAS]|uniref:Uncharacterized protein n=1 Tax=Toxoplasma gondii MAS TaxID=943118 RepID=A0A086QGF9_TOXGO|nr:hypothetical protein TGMAS_202170 [Toxoplasma gondii MAS]